VIWNIFYLVTLLIVSIYIYYLLIFLSGINHREVVFENKKPYTSVIIAARNEEQNISHLLTALVNQSYSKNNYEVIIADDDSSDRTAEIVELFKKKWDNIKLVNVLDRDKAISAKKNALTQAIEISKGEIILSTDADCLVGKYWIESMVSSFNEKQMVVGFSRTQLADWCKARFIRKYEHFDFLAMMYAAAGAISSRKYFSCSGQNIAYKKSAFKQVGGFEKIKHLISGDDVNLMQLFRKSKMDIGFAYSDHSYVYTKPIESTSKFLSQRSRWASNMKWQIILNVEFFVYLLSVFFITFIPFILFFDLWQAGIAILILRMILELLFLKKGYEVFGEDKKKLMFYPIWFILQPFYIIAVALMGGLNLFSWKK